jgi:hypothetical protein
MKELERHAVASRPVINNMIPGLPPVGGGGNQTTGEEFLKTLPRESPRRYPGNG